MHLFKSGGLLHDISHRERAIYREGVREAQAERRVCATPSTPSIGRRVTFWCHMAAPSATVVVPGEPLSGMLRPGGAILER